MSIDRASGPEKGETERWPRPAPGSAGADAAPAGHGPAASIDGPALEHYLRRASAVLRRHRLLLDRLDAALGDGDHGENMAIGLGAVVESVSRTPPDADLGMLLRTIGHVLVASVGGASGPLYGTAFIEAGFALEGSTEVRAAQLADAFDAAVRGLSRRGRCAVGDKTILDALQPAADAVRQAVAAGRPMSAALAEAAWASHAGMRSTIPLVARRGLALRLGERSRGHQDPGATSCFLLVRAMLPAPAERVGGDGRPDGRRHGADGAAGTDGDGEMAGGIRPAAS